jgi:hypothetical protein
MKSNALIALAVLGPAAVPANADVTFHQAVRSVSALTQVNGGVDTITSTTLDPLDVTAQQSAPAVVNGQAVDTGAIAAISCTIDPTGVKGRTRLHGQGFETANAVATTLIDVLVTVDAPHPWRIHSSASVFTPGGLSTMGVSLTNEATGQVVFSTASGTTGVDRLDESGVLSAGTYHFVYDLALVAADGESDRDFTLKFQVPCPADMDDGTGTGEPDGAVSIDDLLYFIRFFDIGDVRADLANTSGQPLPDGAVTIDDLLYFLDRFEAGC